MHTKEGTREDLTWKRALARNLTVLALWSQAPSLRDSEEETPLFKLPG